jgi:hypothetical protein
MQAMQDYWSVLFLAVAAIVMLIIGAPAKAALAGAGFAFVGAALTRAVDVAKEHHNEAKQAEDSRRRDLDETRRLAYAALYARGHGGGMILSTLVNAFAHHELEIDPKESSKHVAAVLDSRNPAHESIAWLQARIDEINTRLDQNQNIAPSLSYACLAERPKGLG